MEKALGAWEREGREMGEREGREMGERGEGNGRKEGDRRKGREMKKGSLATQVEDGKRVFGAWDREGREKGEKRGMGKEERDKKG